MRIPHPDQPEEAGPDAADGPLPVESASAAPDEGPPSSSPEQGGPIQDVSAATAADAALTQESAAGPGAAEPAGATRPAVAFAERAGIVLSRSQPGRYGNGKAAEEGVQRLKGELPVAPSAYVPSGRLPALALMLEAIGAAAGVPAGAAGGAITCALAILLLLLVWGIMAALGSACGVIWCGALVLLIPVVLVGFFGMYGVAGRLRRVASSAWAALARTATSPRLSSFRWCPPSGRHGSSAGR